MQVTFTAEQLNQIIGNLKNAPKGKRLTNNLEKVQRLLESEDTSVEDIMRLFKTKESNGLKKPANAWQQFLKETRPKLEVGLDGKQQVKEASKLWKAMTEDEKKPYRDAAQEESENYKKMKAELSDGQSEDESKVKTKAKKAKKELIESDDQSEDDDDDDEEKESKKSSYYKQIDGIKYDRGLLERADTIVTEHDKITLKYAKELWEDAEDGNVVTECEQRTLQYILENYECNSGAKKFLKKNLSTESDISSETDGESEKNSGSEDEEEKESKKSSYYKQIDGIKYDRGLLERADTIVTEHDKITLKYAKELWEDAEDGNVVTECEQRTLQYILENYECNSGAKKFLKEKILKDLGLTSESD